MPAGSQVCQVLLPEFTVGYRGGMREDGPRLQRWGGALGRSDYLSLRRLNKEARPD